MMIHSEMEAKFDVIAMCRSGHHSIIRWIAGHYSDTTFYNDCLNVATAINGVHSPNANIKDQCADGAGIYEWKDEGFGSCIIRNYEDFRSEGVSKISEKTLKGTKILILRDPYNCFASRIRSRSQRRDWPLSVIDNSIETWIENANAFKSGHVYPISYNQWVVDEEYRKSISKNLLIRPYSLHHLQKVSQFGCGSSFDDLKFDGQASQMDVFNRWKHCKDDQDFKRVTMNLTLTNLAEEIFGTVMHDSPMFN